MVLEEGKSWPEADGDTAEAIDFCEFYAREALRYGGEQPITPYPKEKNELRYIPLGVGVTIPPWNFPLAIMAGMTVAAAVDREHGGVEAFQRRAGDRLPVHAGAARRPECRRAS